MIKSFVFSEGKVVGQDLDLDALRLVRADKGLIIWVDLDRPTQEETKAILETLFGFHPLAVEDCVQPSSLPKVEDYEEYLFLVMHAVDFTRTDKFTTTELNLFLGKEFLVTYHDSELRSVETVKERFAKNVAGTARGADRIAHIVLDTMIYNYKPVVDELTEELEELEDLILGQEKSDCIPQILEMRRELTGLRQIIRPQREVVNRLARGESKLIRPTLLPYFRDLHDNLTRIDETAVNYTERLMLDFDVYINRTANEANEGIKVLTALTAITLPPVIVGSWYGMNFENMPELGKPYAYPVVFVVTLAGMVGMWFWLKSKKWF
jgi:magnesium transporter